MRYKERQVRLYSWRCRLRLTGDIRISRSRGITLRHPPQSTRFSAEHCPSAYATCRSPARPCSPFPRQLQLSPDRGTRSAVSWPKWSGTPASWFLASVSSSLICRALPSGWWRSIITVARRSSTSRKARTPCIWTRLSMSQVPQQCRSAPASRPGLQSGQLHEDTGFAEGGGALVDDDVARQAGEDRGQGCPHGRYVRSNWLRWRCRGTCSGKS